MKPQRQPCEVFCPFCGVQRTVLLLEPLHWLDCWACFLAGLVCKDDETE